MKILNYVSLKLIMIAIACSFAASPPLQAGEATLNTVSARSEGDARLIVARVANFGTFNYLNLFVDGVYVANLGYLRSYEAVLSPGRHVLSVTPELRYSTHTKFVNAEPGRTYAFTAFWKNSYRAYLEKNGSTKRIVTPSNPG